MLTRHHYLLLIALVFVGSAALAELEAHAGEPLVLRWLRTCADHPVRSSLALLFAVRSLAGPTRSTPARGPPMPGKS